ncbi:MAG TPA: hypothetical protein VEK79_05005 [Thermoanaerobaculia bacterium]|nr:hypothetical protein [Thermoanaerobaculia bacterium]
MNSFVRELGQRDMQAREFYCGLGVRRESWFFQHAGRGQIVIGVTDVGEPVEEKAAQFAEADDGFSTWFKARIYALSGVDPDTTPLGPPSVMVHDSSGERLPMDARLVVRAYPLRDRASLDEFIGELRAKGNETRSFYERHRVEESWFLQDTDEGPIVIAVLATDDPERAARTYQESCEPFDEWFKQRVIEVSGVDPNKTPLGPPSEQIFEFTA